MRSAQKYFPCYVLGVALALWLKLSSAQAGSDELLWILAPTVGWVWMLSGIVFEYLPGVGYVNHALQFVVAPSCAGIQFLTILILMLTFSFSHRMGTVKRGMIWTVYALAGAYLYTILVNGIRITLSILIPQLLQQMHICLTWTGQKQLHTIIGTTVYFGSLLLCHQLTDRISQTLAEWFCVDKKAKTACQSCASPVLWYFLIVLGVPFFHLTWIDNQEGFVHYACVIFCVCLAVLGLRRCLQKIIKKARESHVVF